jgi:hypothetical protein
VAAKFTFEARVFAEISKQPRNSSSPSEYVWKPYVEWAVKNPHPPSSNPEYLDAWGKWLNWNDWCTGWWKFERDFGKGKPLLPLSIDLADTLVAPRGEQTLVNGSATG